MNSDNLRVFFCSVWFLTFRLFAQDVPPPVGPSGFIRLANAVAQGSGKVFLEVDGRPVYSDGYELADVTGAIRLEPGKYEVKIKRAGLETGNTKVNVAKDETTTLIPFGEKVPATDGRPEHWRIRILRLKQSESEAEIGGTFVSVCQSPEIRLDVRDPAGAWSPVFVKRLAVNRAPLLYPRGYVPLKAGTCELEPIPVSDEGNYVVLLFEDADGKLRSLNFRDRKFLSAE